MTPKKCENCGLETKDLVERGWGKIREGNILKWFICKSCESKLYPPLIITNGLEREM